MLTNSFIFTTIYKKLLSFSWSTLMGGWWGVTGQCYTPVGDSWCELFGWTVVIPRIWELQLWPGADPASHREISGRTDPDEWWVMCCPGITWAPCSWGLWGRELRGRKGLKKESEMRSKQMYAFSQVFLSHKNQWKFIFSFSFSFFYLHNPQK